MNWGTLLLEPERSLSELGDGAGTLAHGVLGQVGGEGEADGGLDVLGAQSGLLVDTDQVGGLGGETLEDVVDEGVNDLQGLGAEAELSVDTLEGATGVDVPAALGLAVSGLLDSLDGLLSGGLGHCR